MILQNYFPDPKGPLHSEDIEGGSGEYRVVITVILHRLRSRCIRSVLNLLEKMFPFWPKDLFGQLNWQIQLRLDGNGMEPDDKGKAFAVTVTPYAQVLELGDRLILYAVGRPHPGGYYVWTSSDPSIASVEPFLNDGGAQHPNRANVVAHRSGKVTISAMYITPAGASTVGTSEVICRQAKPR